MVGCSKDTDCKGDRICVQGNCVSPGGDGASAPPDLLTPSDLAPSPSDMATPPSDMATSPSDMATSPSDMAMPIIDMAMAPPQDLAAPRDMTTATCMDNLKNGSETDVDCGGGTCGKCADGKMCIGGGDCTSGLCVNNVCTPAATCVDGKKDGQETDVDCGGAMCPKCANGKMCLMNTDCGSNICMANTCVAQGGGGLKMPTFAVPGQYGADKQPIGVGAADYNGDGKLDLAVGNGASSDVSILLGMGDGTFGVPANFSAGNAVTPLMTYAVDLNGDKKADAVVCTRDNNNGDTGFSVLVGAGNGTLGAPTAYFAPSPDANVQLAFADFNGDGRTDVGLAGARTNNGLFGLVYVFTSLNNGALIQKTSLSLPNYFFVGSAAADFNGDGHVDLLAFDGGQVARAVLMTGNGDGTFGGPVGGGSLTFSEVGAATSGDWNGDGKADYASVRQTTGVAAGKGDGTFGAASVYPGSGGSFFKEVLAADMNGDGKVDLVSGGSDGPALTILLGKGDGTFPAALSYLGGAVVEQFALGDFNGDGKIDVAVVDGAVVNVLLNTTP